MSKMIFIPGMKPGHVSGAAGASGRRRAERLVSGSAYRGVATPKNLVPYEDPKGPSKSALEAKAAERAGDVAEAFHFVRDCPNSARERITAVQREAETVPV